MSFLDFVAKTGGRTASKGMFPAIERLMAHGEGGLQQGLFAGFSEINKVVRPIEEVTHAASNISKETQYALPGFSGVHPIPKNEISSSFGRSSAKAGGASTQVVSPAFVNPKVAQVAQVTGSSVASEAASVIGPGGIKRTDGSIFYPPAPGNLRKLGDKTESKGFFKDFGVGVKAAFGKNWANPIVTNAALGAGAGAFGGVVSSAGEFFDPEHIQSQGMVRSAVKGALVGGALGAAHVGLKGGMAMTKAIKGGSGVGHAIAESLADSSIATVAAHKSAAVGGALMMGMIGSTNIRTRSVNPIK